MATLSVVMVLVQGGQPDIGTVARMVLNDWQRGRIPQYVKPPEREVMVYISTACFFCTPFLCCYETRHVCDLRRLELALNKIALNEASTCQGDCSLSVTGPITSYARV
jgi:hypothetical protein